MLVVSFIGALKLFKVLGSSFLLVGGVLYLTAGQSIIDIPRMLTSNLSLLTLLAMLPWMNSVVKSGRFDCYLNELMNVNVADLGKLYTRSSITTLTLAAFLNLSAVSISQDVLKRNLGSLSKSIRNSFINRTTLRGYSLALVWSPLEMLVAVSIFTTGANYVALLPWLLFIAVITFLVDSLSCHLIFKKYSYDNNQVNKSHDVNMNKLMKKVLHLIVSLILFLALVILFGNLLNLDFILTVTMLIFPFAFIWALLMRRGRSFWSIGWKTWKMKMNKMQNFVVLFITLSFFATTLNGTTFLKVIQQPVLFFADFPLMIFFLIQLLFIFLSLFGIHPIATIGILSGIIAPLLQLFNPISLAIVLITSSIATLTVGTYGLLVTLTALNTEQSPYRITFDNLLFAFIFSGIGSLVAYLLL
ncbi:hypothetical protein [Halalkalibacter alkalisediminis]|uniref:hypothetical protein n=1 Tax=Halalkalibacter alkalisediminis TaxID=935616 RepID=UPI0023623DB9|nr:hypothetical protein [Halalkalibacter alkalisediminis]